MRITNKYNLPAPILSAVEANPYTRGDSDISITQLLDPPRLVALTEMYRDELETDASDLIWSLLGQATHHILERSGIASGKGESEKRLYAEVLGKRISGQFDYIDESGVLWDWKVVSVWEYINGLKASRERQLNAYAYLAACNGIEVTGLAVGLIFRDFSVREAASDGSGAYPGQPVMALTIPSWTGVQREAFVQERVRLHIEAQDALLKGQEAVAECTEEERWAKADTWAVIKKGNKKASRVFTSEDAANGYISAQQASTKDSYYVEYREGESTRCRYYCSVKRFCEQATNY